MPLYPSKARPKQEEEAELNLNSLMDTFTIILVFLIKQYGTSVIDVAEKYKPPIAQTRLEVDRVMTLQIKDQPNGQLEYRIGDQPPKQEWKDDRVGFRSLRADLEMEKKIVDAALTEETLKGALNIVGDQTLRYSSLMGVLRAASGAGFYRLKLVAEP